MLLLHRILGAHTTTVWKNNSIEIVRHYAQ